MPRPHKAHAEPIWPISQAKFWPKKPVMTVSGRKIVATIVRRSWTSLLLPRRRRRGGAAGDARVQRSATGDRSRRRLIAANWMLVGEASLRADSFEVIVDAARPLSADGRGRPRRTLRGRP
jgi:hypothetical protein